MIFHPSINLLLHFFSLFVHVVRVKDDVKIIREVTYDFVTS